MGNYLGLFFPSYRFLAVERVFRNYSYQEIRSTAIFWRFSAVARARPDIVTAKERNKRYKYYRTTVKVPLKRSAPTRMRQVYIPAGSTLALIAIVCSPAPCVYRSVKTV